MQDIKVNAINLKSFDYKENDKILTLFTYEKGLLTVRIKGVKKAQAKLKFASEPFCFGEYNLVLGNGGLSVIGCNNNELFYNLRSNLDLYTAGCCLLEYCSQFIQENQADTVLFTLLIKCLNMLCYGTAKAENLLLYFLINALGCNGYKMDYCNCFSCGKEITDKAYIDLNQGGFMCGNCCGKNFNAVPLAVFKTFKFIYLTDLERLSTINTGKNNVLHALKCVNAFIEDVSGKRLKSLKEFLNNIQL